MTARRTIRAAATIACGSMIGLGWATMASASDKMLVDKLAPQIVKRCKALPTGAGPGPGGATGTISAAGLAQAFEASEALPLVVTYGKPMSPESIALRAFPPKTGDATADLRLIAEADEKHVWLRRLVETGIDPKAGINTVTGVHKYLPLEEGGFVVGKKTGAFRDGDERLVLISILSGEDRDFVFYCNPGQAPEEVEDSKDPDLKRKSPFKWVVAKAPGDFTKPLKDRTFAEAAMTVNKVSDEETYAIYGAIGVSLEERLFPIGPSTLVRLSPSAYFQVEREGGDVPADGDNNLYVGLQARGLLHVGQDAHRTHAYSLDLKYQTDDDFDSRVWTASALFTPQLLPLGSGNLVPIESGDGWLSFVWGLSLNADWSWVDDPGQKAELLTKDEFGRLGADLDAMLKLRPTDGPLAISLSATYKSRWDLTDNDADADLLNVRLLLEPNENFAFGLAYDEGENLDTLKYGEQWRLTFGYRY